MTPENKTGGPPQKQKVFMLPYVKVNGAWSLPDEIVRQCFRLMQRDGSDKVCFMDGIDTPEKFLQEMQNHSFLYVMAWGAGIAGCCWLNNAQAQSAMIHFCVFSELWGNRDIIDGCKWALQMILWNKDESGNFVFDALFGLVPETNEYAVRFSRKIASREIGKTDYKYSHPASGDMSVPGVLFLYTRKGERPNESYYLL